MNTQKSTSGQALITLLLFVVIGFTVTATALYLAISSIESLNKTQNGALASSIAETGAENAVLRLLRDPTGYRTDAMDINSGHVEIEVSGSNPSYIITSTGSVGSFVRKIQVELSYTSNRLTVQSWKEIQ